MVPRKSRPSRRCTVRPPHPRDLEGARRLAGQALKTLEAIPPEMAKSLADEVCFSKIPVERSLGTALRYIGGSQRTNTGVLGIKPAAPRREEHRHMAAQLLREARRQPKPPITPPGPGRAGYVKEIVVRYKLRRIPYRARLVGRGVFHSRDAFELFRNLYYEPREHIMVVHLNGGNRVISVDHAATGTPTECPFSASVVFRDAMLAGAAAIVIVHNHPSGRCEPSPGDFALMDEAKRTGDFLRIPLLDFIIIGDDTYWSASDRCLLGRAPGTIPAPADTRPKARRMRSAKRKAAGCAAPRGNRRSGASGN